MTAPYRTIIHATDFSEVSASAFAHAMKFAIAARAKLYLLHVGGEQEFHWHTFPAVRQFLQNWGLLAPGARSSDLDRQLGIRVSKVDLPGRKIGREISQFAHEHQADMLVLGTHGREGLPRWIVGSVAEEIAERAKLPALFVGQGAKPFVEMSTGHLRLARALVPVGRHPKPARALNELRMLVDLLRPEEVVMDVVHVGDKPPHILSLHDNEEVPVECVSGPVVETIVDLATARGSDLIVMPTDGCHGFTETWRGTKTQQVVREAPCPVLALPA